MKKQQARTSRHPERAAASRGATLAMFVAGLLAAGAASAQAPPAAPAANVGSMPFRVERDSLI